MNNKTKNYYDKIAKSYFELTSQIDMSEICERFLWYLENNSTILDFGCGSGRDIKYFKDKGFKVHGIDGSKELCEFAKKYSHCNEIDCIDFLEFDRQEMYDGIFACASLLHLNEGDVRIVLNKLINACFDHGIIYVSFKYGDFEGYRDNRYYLDMTDKRLIDLIYEYEELSIEDLWMSDDSTKDHQPWINVILRVVK